MVVVSKCHFFLDACQSSVVHIQLLVVGSSSTVMCLS